MLDYRFEKENKRAAAYDGDKLVGRCEFTNPGSFWIITHTIVDSNYGGQGIAGKVLDLLMSEAKKEGVSVKPICSYAVKKFKDNSDYAAMEDKSTITMFSMKTCPHCEYTEPQVAERKDFNIIDISEHIAKLKQFLKLRDNNSAFDEAKKGGFTGIPCFVFENGAVTLNPEDLGLHKMPKEEPKFCSLDGSGC